MGDLGSGRKRYLSFAYISDKVVVKRQLDVSKNYFLDTQLQDKGVGNA